MRQVKTWVLESSEGSFTYNLGGWYELLAEILAEAARQAHVTTPYGSGFFEKWWLDTKGEHPTQKRTRARWEPYCQGQVASFPPCSLDWGSYKGLPPKLGEVCVKDQ